jgi:hypothetical protein
MNYRIINKYASVLSGPTPPLVRVRLYNEKTNRHEKAKRLRSRNCYPIHGLCVRLVSHNMSHLPLMLQDLRSSQSTQSTVCVLR